MNSPVVIEFSASVLPLNSLARDLYNSLVETQLKVQRIDDSTRTHFADEWSICLKEFLDILGASETAATELAVMIKYYLSLPIWVNDPSMINDLIEELNRLVKKLQGWDFDRTAASDALNKKLGGIGQKITTAIESRGIALRREVDEAQAERVALEKQLKDIQEKKRRNQGDTVEKKGAANVWRRLAGVLSGKRRQRDRPDEEASLTERLNAAQKRLRRATSDQQEHKSVELAPVQKAISDIQGNLKAQSETLKSLYSGEKNKLMKELENSLTLLQDSKTTKASQEKQLALRNAKQRAVSSSEIWKEKATILLEDYAKAPHRTTAVVLKSGRGEMPSLPATKAVAVSSPSQRVR